MKDQNSLPALLAAKDWPAAERLLRRLAKGKAPQPAVFYNLAKVLEAGGKPDQMKHWLERAVAANPSYGVAWFELGRITLDHGALADALTAFLRASALMPDDADTRRNLGRVALRLGDWDRAAECFAAKSDPEARLARYRIAAETRSDTSGLRDALLAERGLRPEVIKTLTRTAKGSVPLNIES
ncbi:MAG: tetratricopeptide repeat protein [Yoonia sp.]